jgi:RNA-binding protein Musashi
VGGLSWQTTPEKLREYFGQFGTVTDVLVMKDPVTQVRTFWYNIPNDDPGSML